MEEGQAAGRCPGVERSGNDKAFATLLQGPRCRDERPAPQGRLDDHRRVGQPADDPVAPRERPGARLDEWEEFLKDRYPQEQSGSASTPGAVTSSKQKEQFRNYEADARPSVRLS